MADLADIVRGEAPEYLRTHHVTPVQLKALRAVTRCRTRKAGSVTVKCGQCGDLYRLFRSCRNYSCPSCLGEARAKWLAARLEEILPVEYLHVVFTTPSELNVLALFCPREFYEALIRSAGQAVIDVGRFVLHAQLGCINELQTWTQLMAYDPHAHCAVPAGGFSKDGTWISFKPKDLPAAALAKRFRSLLCKRIRKAAQQGKFKDLPNTISVEQLLAKVRTLEWKVYSEPAFGGPQKLFEYLSRYVYRVAITNDRIESYENRQVIFRRRARRYGKEVKRSFMRGQEFLRRWLLHNIPPKRFVRIRSYGFLGNRNRKRNLERARQLIGKADQTPQSPSRQPFQPLRLCPKCFEQRRKGRTLHFAPPPECEPQIDLPLRSPPIRPVAA